jgi:hypothetical protein
MLASADLTREVVEAKRDGVITPNENAAISRAGMKAQDAIGKLLRAAGPTPSSPQEATPPGAVRLLKPGQA